MKRSEKTTSGTHLSPTSSAPNASLSSNETLTPDPIAQAALEAAKAAIEKNGERVKVIDLRGLSSLTDFFVLSSAHSDRQLQTIADYTQEILREKQGRKARSVEGYQEKRWILVDFGDLVVHVFLDPLRDYYGLDQLWEQAPQLPLPQEFFTGTSKGAQ